MKPNNAFTNTLHNHEGFFILFTKIFVIIIFAFGIALGGLLLLASPGRDGSQVDSFIDEVITLSDNWTITDSAGNKKNIQLPYTVEYGYDGVYTLTGVLPKKNIATGSPVICFYSNYTDLHITIDGKTVCVYPDSPKSSTGATGNTYHYFFIPSDFAGKTLTATISAQLGDDITYLLKPPLLGSKSTMLYTAVLASLPGILLAGCMLIISGVLTAFYFVLRRRLKLDCSTAYITQFAVLFSIYVFCETSFAQMIIPNSYALFCCTLMLLALLPIPLMGLFGENVSSKFKRVPIMLMTLCSANFVVQAILNYTGVSSFRVMLPATHTVIIFSIAVMIICLVFSDNKEKAPAMLKLASAIPMIVGGTLDIILIIINRPSFNNSMWFTLGVTAFVVIQFCCFIRGFFEVYRSSLEAQVLRNMAYRDLLTDTGNRNAYEKKLSEITDKSLEQLSCLVIDINDLKRINDSYGHSAGDLAIVETSKILNEFAPDGASCFRTGGDEFVILMNGVDEKNAKVIADTISEEATQRGKKNNLPLSLAVGSGSYKPDDGNVLSFICRVDADMYSKKRASKHNPLYSFSQQ